MRVTVRALLVFWPAVGAARMLIGATSALFLLSRGISAGDLMYLKAMQAAVILALELPLGYLADRIGRMRTIVLGTVCSTAWLGITAGAPSVEWLFVAEAFNAISLATFSGAAEAEFVDAWKREHPDRPLGEAFVRLSRWSFRATAAAALCGSFLVPVGSATTWWVATAAMTGLTVVAAVFAARENRARAATPQRERPDLWLMVREVLPRARELRAVVLTGCLLGVGYQVLIQYWQLGAAAGGGLGGQSWLLSIAFLLILLVQAEPGRLARLFARIPTLGVAAMAVPAVVLAALVQLGAHWALVLAAVLLYFWTYQAVMVDVSVRINDAIPDGCRATVLSMRSALTRVGILAVAPVIAWTSSSLGAFVVAAAVLTAALLVQWIYRASTRNPTVTTDAAS